MEKTFVFDGKKYITIADGSMSRCSADGDCAGLSNPKLCVRHKEYVGSECTTYPGFIIREEKDAPEESCDLDQSISKLRQNIIKVLERKTVNVETLAEEFLCGVIDSWNNAIDNETIDYPNLYKYPLEVEFEHDLTNKIVDIALKKGIFVEYHVTQSGGTQFAFRLGN